MPQAVEPLIRLLEDPDMQVRTNAADALGSAGASARAAIPFLRKATGDPESQVSRAARRALQQLGSP